MKLLYILTGLFFLTSCQQQNTLFPTESGKGILFLSSLTLQTETINQINTRGVSSDLAIEISNANGVSVAKYDAGAIEASQKIELEAGIYTLKAYSTNFGTTWENNDPGAPIYYKEQAFSIEAEEVKYLSVQVPMINFGVRFILPDNFSNSFGSCTFAVQLDERSVILQEDEIAYFNLPPQKNIPFLYTLTATNTDNEIQSKTDSYSDMSPGVIYEITYGWTNQSKLNASVKTSKQ